MLRDEEAKEGRSARMEGDEHCLRMYFWLVLSQALESMEHGCNAEVVIDTKPYETSSTKENDGSGSRGTHLGFTEAKRVGRVIVITHIIFVSPGPDNSINPKLGNFLISNGWTFSESSGLSSGRRFIDIQSAQTIVDAEEQPELPTRKTYLPPSSQFSQNLHEAAPKYSVNVTFLVKDSKDLLKELADALAGTLAAKQDMMIIIEEDMNFLTWLIKYRLTLNRTHPNLLVCFLADLRNGKQAVDAFAKEQFHLIFMDLRMPVMDGVAESSTTVLHQEATRQIRRLERELKHPPAVIVALTSSVSAKDRQQALELAATTFWANQSVLVFRGILFAIAVAISLPSRFPAQLGLKRRYSI
ncbi:hypothetical protein BJ742DRAFT_742056 [Cladochytrium replicatum]|nr:hypothetical protein BJ742DRAFT_742056 [Cladochytrium replicatum]